MGKDNDIFCKYLDERGRFADLFNAAFFHGRQEIKPDDLEEASEVYTGIKEKNKTFYRIRDLKKKLKNGITLKVLAIEAQGYIDYSMPWRCMNYDDREYERQLSNIKQNNRCSGQFRTISERLCQIKSTDRLFPVFTVCLYHGTEPWDGPRTLKDMMDFGQDIAIWEKWFTDYPANLICINEWKNYSLFRTSLGEVFQMLPYRKDRAGLRKFIIKHPEYEALDEDTAMTLGVLMGVDKLIENREKYKKEDKYNMCQALREMMDESKEAGRKEGLECGIERGIEKGEGYFAQLTEKLLEESRYDDLKKAAYDRSFRMSLYKEWGIK